METKFESLKGKRVLITGSSRGIGKALAIGFAQNGAHVVLHGTQKSPAMDETLQTLFCYEGKHLAVYGNLSDPKIPKSLITQTVQQLGGIDILICNASIQFRKPWIEITDEEMELQTQTNVFSTLRLIQLAVPYMKQAGQGRIITTGSIQQEKPHPDMLIYSANKSSVHNMVKSLALQLAPDHITVNNIAVGVIQTDRNAQVLKNTEYYEQVRSSIPLKRIGEPNDCVGSFLMLASDAGSYITGENLHVDGGKFL